MLVTVKTLDLNGRTVVVNSLEVDNVVPADYPDFSDAYFSYGEYSDGTELSDSDLEQLGKENHDVLHEMAYDSYL